ncbi:MAG: membrane protein insertion efficiency factor YidD [Planctomycetota bacterium]
MTAFLKKLPATLFIFAVRCYQAWISPILGPTCRFRPTCSQYAVEAVQKYGVVRGGWKAVRRIARCHPFHPGGYDPP